MEKKMIFKQQLKGDSKKTNQPYHMIELHDPETLENTMFTINPVGKVDASRIPFRSSVIAVLGMSTYGGRPQLTLEALKPTQ